ncbi:glycosyltransferase family 9 protein [Glaciecola sp. KUL10]|uniref:glycosyltransferase family 9 protein n=1 Tax=Glaciecola sp. (strain KUL10) TaxID=2161813 RepID=UPI000D788186|nr:glycosyltransferase family 9 protein [Glaciecola sp. KUL10]GBL05727.1 ADP-heptose--LPS heptosyltransferase [Glaciecola sp. KUL10]
MTSSYQLCILRLSAIGDVCHAAAMVNEICSRLPQVKITWIIGKVEYQLLKGLPNVEFIVYDKKGGKAAKQKVKDQLAGRKFDALFLMQVALRANLLSLVVNAKRRIGFDWERSKEGHRLFVNEYIAKQTHGHVLEGFMGFADKLFFEMDVAKLEKHPNTTRYQPSWNIPISEDDKQWVDEQLNALGKFIVISPAASKAERNWHAQGYATVAARASELGYKVVLCGGPGPLDKLISDQILAINGHIDLNLVGKTTLKQMLQVLAKASLVVAPDTGPAHMATTVNTPVLGLYAHSNPLRTGPYLSLEHTISVYDECIEEQHHKPWTSLKWGIRAKGSDLMSRIDEARVIKMLEKLLNTINN